MADICRCGHLRALHVMRRQQCWATCDDGRNCLCEMFTAQEDGDE